MAPSKKKKRKKVNIGPSILSQSVKDEVFTLHEVESHAYLCPVVGVYNFLLPRLTSTMLLIIISDCQ
jgi:hypothetical protein